MRLQRQITLSYDLSCFGDSLLAGSGPGSYQFPAIDDEALFEEMAEPSSSSCYYDCTVKKSFASSYLQHCRGRLHRDWTDLRARKRKDSRFWHLAHVDFPNFAWIPSTAMFSSKRCCQSSQVSSSSRGLNLSGDKRQL